LVNWATEGTINKLKVTKQSAYGRMKMNLLE